MIGKLFKAKLSLILAAVILCVGCSIGSFKSGSTEFWWAALATDTDIGDLAISSQSCDITVGRYRSDKTKGAEAITEGAVKGAIQAFKPGL